MKQNKIIVILILFSFIFSAKSTLAGTATLSWNANTEPDLASYKIYYGTTPRTGSDPKVCSLCGYSSSINVGNVTSYVFSSLTNGLTYYFSISAIDTTGNESSFSAEVSKNITVPDTTAPVVSGVTASSITQNSAVIVWTTNELSDTQIDYGLTVSYGSQTSLSATMVTTHSQTLTNLSSGTTYHYRVKSRDAAGNQAISADYIFSTIANTNPTAPF